MAGWSSTTACATQSPAACTARLALLDLEYLLACPPG
jgi:hypothetical protein